MNTSPRILAASVLCAFLVIAPDASATSTRATDAAELAALVSGAAKPAPRVRSRIPAKFRKAIPKASKIASALAIKALNKPFKPSRKKATRRVAFMAATQSMAVPGASATVGGVKIESSADIRRGATGSFEAELQLVLSSGDVKVVIEPLIKDTGKDIGDISCPAADGLIEFQYTHRVGRNTKILDGNRVLWATSEKVTRTIKTRAHVGRDARLARVESDITVKAEHHQRGLQSVNTITRHASSGGDGPVSLGSASASASFQSAGDTARQRRAAEQSIARELEQNDPFEDSVRSLATRIRDHIKSAEPKWYDLPNNCARLTLDPASPASLGQNESVNLHGGVEATSGGEAAAQFAQPLVSHGTLSVEKPTADPGDRARFKATGASPDSRDRTVVADLIATSTAGRAAALWIARNPVPGVNVTFSGTAAYTRFEGNGSTDTEHSVSADYEWSITYSDVRLEANGLALASDSSFSGTWSDDGRHGAAGPGDFLCAGELVSHSPQSAMLTTATSGGGFRINAMAFLMVTGDAAATNCTGLPGPPYASYSAVGNTTGPGAVVDVTAEQLAAGTITRHLTFSPPATDCANVTAAIDPCSQALEWSGTVTIERAGS